MDNSTIQRAFTGDYEVRASREGRIISGIVVPFDTVARVSDGGAPYDESFKRGAFAKSIAEQGDRVKLLYQHNSLEPIGRATLLREDAAGLYGEFHVSDVQRGDEAINLVADGVIDSFSVGFRPINAVKRGGVTVRTEVAIREASLVTFPAYADARISAIRSAIRASLGDIPPEEMEALVRQFLLAADLPESSEATDDGRPVSDAVPVDEPASATRDASTVHRSLRRRAREMGII